MNLTDTPIGIDAWFLDEGRRKCDSEVTAIRRGLDLGLRMVDTAEMYGSGAGEELVGEAIAGRHDDVFLASKVFLSNASASGVRRALEASPYRLNTDRLDLYLYHWRGHHQLEETVEALQAAVDNGLIGAWGVSNLDPADMDDFADPGVIPATNQILYNLLRRGSEYDLLPLMRERGVDLMTYLPLEQGRLFQGQPGKLLPEITAEVGTTPVALALARAVRESGSIAIPRTSSPERIEENVSALQVTLIPETLRGLDEVFTPPSGPRPLEVLRFGDSLFSEAMGTVPPAPGALIGRHGALPDGRKNEQDSPF